MKTSLTTHDLLVALATLGLQLGVTTHAIAADQFSSPPSGELAAWINARVVETSAGKTVALVDDATFARRAYLDLHGTIPTVAELRDFLEDTTSDKRALLINRLVADKQFDKNLARVWRTMLVPREARAGSDAVFEEWLARQFAADVPFDDIARQIVTAGGAETTLENGAPPPDSAPTTYLQAAGGDAAGMAGSITRDFLGVRLECAQCHDHPFAKWKQDEFWGVAAFFAGAALNRPRSSNGTEGDSLRDEFTTVISPPDIGRRFDANYLWSEVPVVIESGKLPRQLFAQWLTSAENPHFAATTTNRVWRQLCGNGLTESVDDLDTATPEERAGLLDPLAKQFVEKQFDLKWLVSGICKSKPYQYAVGGDNELARPMKVLSPEQVYDAIETALGLPISRVDEGPRFNGERDQLIARLSEAASRSPQEFRSGVPQTLLLMNGSIISTAVDVDSGRTIRAISEAPFLDRPEKLETLFLATLNRYPTESEAERLLAYMARAEQPDSAEPLAEIMWALVNSSEFILQR